jgi:hypothetical protein
MSYRRYKNSDKSLVFAEYFNSEQEVRRNGGIPTDVTFDKGRAQFDGADSVIQYEGINVTSPFSFRCIATFDASVDTSDVISQFDGSGGALLMYASGQLRFYSSVGGSYANITTGTGRHEIVCTYDGTTSRIYANNVEGASVSGTTPPLSQRDTFLGMRYDTTNELEGSLEFVEIYNKALTAEEVSNLYNDARYVVPNLEHEAQGDGTDLNVSVCENEDYTSFSDASRTGFRASSDGNLVQNAGMADELSLNSGDRVLVTFDIELHSGNMPNINLTKSLGGTYWSEEGTQDCTSGFNKFVFTADSTAIGVIDFWTPNGVTTDFTITNLSVQALAVEPTSKILHVNAFDGVARNLLSGDSTGDSILVNDHFDDTSEWSLGDGWSIANGKASCDGTQSTFSVIEDLSCGTETGKEYNIVYKLSGVSAGTVRYVNAGGSNHYGDWISEDGVYQDTFISTGATFRMQADADFIGSVEYIIVQEVIPEVTNTDIEVVKDGAVRVPRFNGNTSKIDCGDYHDLTGDITFMCWYRLDVSKMDSTTGRIIETDTFAVNTYASSRNIAILSGGGGVEYSDTGSLVNREWVHIACARRADGTMDYYFDAEFDGDTGRDGLTPVAATTDISIGNRLAGGRNAAGEISEVMLLEGLLTAEEISQYYTATKHLYGK